MTIVTTTNIIGYITLPDDTVREKSKVIFQLTGHDTDDASSAVVAPWPIEADIAADGSIDVDLWANDDGVRSTLYAVTLSLYNGRSPTLVDLGKIEVPDTGGPYDLNDLLPVAPPAGASVADYLAYLQSAVFAVESSETNAASSASNALVSELKAEEWAVNPEDVEVETGKYSAYHYSVKTSAGVADAINSAAAAASSADAANVSLLALGDALANDLGAFSVDADGDLSVSYNGNSITDIEINADGNLLMTYTE
jgi:hypothetical protein